mmetsp:Transcript_19918/g.49448  ORF Transcript_19918/g.49448 Transcript_19918/m.49448 type:complete len:100 (-) Transcript_19918:215-514(-)
MTKYYIAMASKKFLLEQEPIEEMLRERTQYYESNNLAIDFWFIKDLQTSNSPEIAKFQDYLKRPAAMIVSTNETFINWIKLRVQNVLVESFESKVELVF